MRQLIIIFWDLGIGGVQTRVQGLVQRIIHQKKDVEITLLLYERKKNEIKIIDHPRVIIKVFPGPKKIKILGFKKKIWRFTTAQFIFWLFRELWLTRPHRVITFLNKLTTYVFPYILCSKLFLSTKTKLVINEPVVISKYLKQYEQWWWKWLVIINYYLADKIIVAAKAVKFDLVKNFKVAEEKIVVVKSWVEKL